MQSKQQQKKTAKGESAVCTPKQEKKTTHTQSYLGREPEEIERPYYQSEKGQRCCRADCG